MFDRRTKTAQPLWPSPDVVYEPDTEAFPGCDAPPDEGKAATHGINAVETEPGKFMLYAVYHGSRESVEIFDLDLTGGNSRVAWRGCVVVPEGVAANGVVAMPDGGIAVTNFTDPREPLLPQLFTGEPSGSVYTWQRARGWSEVAGSAAFGPNGVEVSSDGETLYIAEAMKKRVVSIPVTGGTLTEVATMSFLPDNLRWSEDGALLTTGMEYEPLTAESIQSCAMEGTGCVPGFTVVSVDPVAKTSDTVFSTTTDDYRYATVAAQVGSEIWIGGNAISQIGLITGLP
ncbi:SMP-30/gluconolactonase/LRE family protein [Rhodococcus sp. NBC_00294]|uniref:SMP-30/gluconolactonase/LRE family protein n=1 Tax=Rhodococcus sp. NBC_00294 TaxID=2976004 RepID=UPI002E2BE4C0|nr:SMP-30/gluconolactonase/LRE family protein [Rhodococcus sp. NBC_00294]